MKRLLMPMVVLLLLAIIITGCSSSSSPTTSQPVTSASPSTSTAASTSTAPPTSATSRPATSVPATTAASTTTAPSANKYGGTLRVIETAGPGAPIGAEWEGNAPPVYNTQQWAEERLMKEKLDGTMQPELAESWEVTATGTDPNVVLHLRKGVKFADGTDWNAQALAWNLKIYKDTAMFGSTTNYWKSWDIVDDYTVKLHYSVYLNTLTRAWENYFFVSPTSYTKNGIDYTRTHMVGTAAFSQTDFQRDVSTTLVKNQNYWQQGRPYIDKVQLLYVADQLTREALMRSGGAEMLNAIPQQVANFPTTDYKIISRPVAPSMLAPDSANKDSPWSNVKVRMAVDYAIDKASMAKALGFGYGSPAYQLASINSKAYDPGLEATYRKFDVAKAKQLMSDAGYPNGFSTTLILQPGGPTLDQAVYVQAAMKSIGITAAIQTPEPAAFQGIYTGPLKTSTVLMVLFGEWSNFNTSLNVFFPRTGGGFYMPSLQKPGGPTAWDAVLTQSLTTPVPDPVILRQIMDSFYNDVTVIPLMYSSAIYITSPKLMDTGLATYGTVNAWDYANTWLSK